jgi:hypothetical protein
MKNLLLLSFLFTGLFLFGQNLTVGRLTNRAWGEESRSQLSTNLYFQDNGLFSGSVPGPAYGGGTKGTYSLKGNTVLLHVEEDNLDIFGGPGTYTLSLHEDSLSPFSRSYLLLENSKGSTFYDFSDSPVGQKRYFDRVQGVVLAETRGITTDNLSIRDFPSLTGKKYTYVIPEDQEYPYLPQGTEVRVIARTESTYSIDGEIDDYWYYVVLVQYLYGTPFLKSQNQVQGGWVYGYYLSRQY